MARVSTHRLEELMREADVLSTIKGEVPNAWRILEMEINRARAAVVGSVDNPDVSGHPLQPHVSDVSSAPLDHLPQRQSIRKRVKLRVPAEQYPDYNFVGRLLGPRGATLKRLERDTGCRIMIRGKGSIRKDKEAEVRGKPGWEHVFHEPLHVVIEVVDAADDVAAQRILQHARELVEMLLIPVPEERDSLKRAQLRDLAILNGTHRSVSDLLSASVQGLGLGAAPRNQPPPLASSPPPLRRAHSQHSKPAPKMYSSDYGSVFEGSGAFSRHNTTSFSPNPNQQRNTANVNAYPASSGFMAGSQDSLLPDLEKLHIPALDFDHLSEANISSNNGGFPMPSPSPTIVDPEIYPYPPTPGLLNVDQQISAFGSPMWTPTPTATPARPSAGSMSSTSLPPRSPPAVGDTNGASGASFLLGRALGDPTRHGQSQYGREAQREGLPFEQTFASQVNQYGETEGRDAVSQQQQAAQHHPFAGMKNANGDSIILANLFPTTGTQKGEPSLERSRNEQLQQQSAARHDHTQQSPEEQGPSLSHSQQQPQKPDKRDQQQPQPQG